MESSRMLYTLLGSAALPLLPLRLWWRGRREPRYRERIGERFGRYRGSIAGPVYWIHAVSVGETRAAVPLVQRLKAMYPEAAIVVTHMTATGQETAETLFGDRVIRAWLPYDV
ncbi:MAG TPA: glycosyltransferase N-terminal domain-containing protein, partial [Casimicrobiaceae bacterium]